MYVGRVYNQGLAEFGSAELSQKFLTKNGRNFGSVGFRQCQSSVDHYLHTYVDTNLGILKICVGLNPNLSATEKLRKNDRSHQKL